MLILCHFFRIKIVCSIQLAGVRLNKWFYSHWRTTATCVKPRGSHGLKCEIVEADALIRKNLRFTEYWTVMDCPTTKSAHLRYSNLYTGAPSTSRISTSTSVDSKPCIACFIRLLQFQNETIGSAIIAQRRSYR